MSGKLYVGGLNYKTTQDELTDLFAQCGEVASAKVITDRETGRSKGFGFVEMTTDDAAQNAITKFNGTEFDGRKLTVSEARPQEKRESGGAGRSRDAGNRW